jgi:hypothetical protein
MDVDREYIGRKLLTVIFELHTVQKADSGLLQSVFTDAIVAYLSLTDNQHLATGKQVQSLWRMDAEKAGTWLDNYCPGKPCARSIARATKLHLGLSVSPESE